MKETKTKPKYSTKVPGAQVEYDLGAGPNGEWVYTLEDGREVRHFNKHIAERRAKRLAANPNHSKDEGRAR